MLWFRFNASKVCFGMHQLRSDAFLRNILKFVMWVSINDKHSPNCLLSISHSVEANRASWGKLWEYNAGASFIIQLIIDYQSWAFCLRLLRRWQIRWILFGIVSHIQVLPRVSRSSINTLRLKSSAEQFYEHQCGDYNNRSSSEIFCCEPWIICGLWKK